MTVVGFWHLADIETAQRNVRLRQKSGHRYSNGRGKTLMTVSIRMAQKGDAVECGRIIHSAFAAIAAHHNFPPDFPSAEVATGVASMLIDHPRFYGIVAEPEGKRRPRP